jgi:alkane 1-monooxygenase
MTTDVASPAWVDRKRPYWALGATQPFLPIVGYSLVRLTGMPVFWWFGVFFVFVLTPILDVLAGTDASNPPESAVAALEADRYYRHALYAAVPGLYFSFVWSAWMLARGGLDWAGTLGLTTSLGIVTGGVGISVAHELGHKNTSLERFLAKLSLLPVAYGHFFVEHNRGHHVRVATPEDPASARYGESFYAFYPRVLVGSIRSAWDIEKRRLSAQGHSAWHWRNDNLQTWGGSLVLYVVLAAWVGWSVLPLLVLQALYGSSLLESINYVEHYGLLRQKRADGRYESCRPEHSWNNNHIVTNLFLYHLQRHSDHHAHASRSYQALRHFDECPALPAGYATMIVLAYVPPLWFRVMNPRVSAHYGGDIGKAHRKPRDRRPREIPASAQGM